MSKFLKLCSLSVTVTVTVTVTVAVLLAACGPDHGPGAGNPAAQSSAAAPVEQTVPPPPVEQKNPDVDFAVSPDTVPGCDETSALQARISWQVRNTAVEQVRVEVADPGQENWKVLSVAGRQGEVETGPWVLDGTRFRLVNATTDEQLAAHMMMGHPCN
ncbi:hypothetical protein N792_01565 [Lysobacter concretionis Ko07 = DSM 16239]|uniref:Lipoprotein n=1 Tax=Lysobacter concretionis Ko07 = DSM 16239 TaxID=1122185 RepID=A0A0A0ER70_9GAMM|nr:MULTISPECIES: hypothetical protein [Lysobacter]KGM52944.1 hypothetical protein N792_01565 [Lysobacter concretionis Ko07 = DSM 16239]QOD91382.1 hypothetical protein H2514_01520 [Lysobacter sp. CW239]